MLRRFFRSKAAKRCLDGGEIKLFWYNRTYNLGDLISPLVVEALSGKKARHCPIEQPPKLISTGSVLGAARKGDVVWGTGAMFPENSLGCPEITVCAVRGPLTRRVLTKEGVECPEVYGDPAILLNEIFPAEGTGKKKYKLGICPHYVDKDTLEFDDPSVTVLDIQTPLEEYLPRMLECERIVSSSLHGVIIAETYGVPADWMVISDKVAGDGFKFRDYYLSTDREPPEPLNRDNLLAERKWNEPRFDRKALARAFPLRR
jgi:pyruvyltransferase